MNNFRWIPIVAAVVLAAVIGGIAYNAGVVVGMEQAGTIGPRPWGFPFFFGPLFFIFFGIMILRGFFWGGRGWHRHRCGGGLDEWHRRAHERMWNDPSGERREGTARE